MKDTDQSSLQQLHHHLSYGNNNAGRYSQFPILSSLTGSGTLLSNNGRLPGSKPNANSPVSTYLLMSKSSTVSSARSHSTTASGEPEGSVRLSRIQPTRFVGSENRRTKPRKTDAATPTLPSILKNSTKNDACGDSEHLHVSLVTQGTNGNGYNSGKSEEENAHDRCKHCGSTFHKSEEHFSNNIVDKEQVRRISKLKRRRRRRKKNERVGEAEKSETVRKTVSDRLGDSPDKNNAKASDGNDRTGEKITKEPANHQTFKRKTRNRRDFNFHYRGSSSDTLETSVSRKTLANNGSHVTTENPENSKVHNKGNPIKRNAEIDGAKTHKSKSNFAGSKENQPVSCVRGDTEKQNQHQFGTNRAIPLRKSKSLLGEKVTIHSNRQTADRIGLRRAHFAQNRSATIHGVRGPRLDETATKESAQCDEKSKERNNVPNCTLSAYHSVAKIPESSTCKQNSQRRTTNETSISSSCASLHSSCDSQNKSSTSGLHMLSMKDITQYRKTRSVYLDAKWKKTRKDRFYHSLEDAQVKRWKEKKLAAIREQRKAQETKEKQLKQLRYIRNKHENRRNTRLSTQHVKWKYVLGGVGSDSDRAEYGLPSEYYTHYGFAPDHLKVGAKKKNIHVTVPGTRKTKSASKARATGDKNAILPTEKELDELRRRNKERYDHIFATRSKTQVDILRGIIRDGLYTVEVEEEVEEGVPTSNEGDPSTHVAGQKAKPPLLKKTSRLVVKDVVNEAKRILDVLDENSSDEHDTKSSDEDE